MDGSGIKINKNIEIALREILKSKSRSLIYLYLLKKNGVQTSQIIKGTNLHPSTVRETLSEMHDQGLIIREKLKKESIGKNPYKYYPIPPVKLLKRYVSEVENRLNKIANLTKINKEDTPQRVVSIKIKERV